MPMRKIFLQSNWLIALSPRKMLSANSRNTFYFSRCDIFLPRVDPGLDSRSCGNVEFAFCNFSFWVCQKVSSVGKIEIVG